MHGVFVHRSRGLHPRRRAVIPRFLKLACPAIALVDLGASAASALTESTNWSGYAATSGTAFTDVSDTFVVPSLTAPSSGTSYSSFWVGLDGATGTLDPTVEQCGIQGTISAGQSSGTYYPWFEFAPAGQEEIENFSINAGDTIHLDATYEPSESTTGNYAYLFDIDDESTGQSFDQTEFTSTEDQRSSAEWIAEATSLKQGTMVVVQTLANFGSVTLTNCVAALNGGADQSAASLGGTGYEIIQANEVVAIPSNLNSTGEIFTDYCASSLPNLVWKDSTGNKQWDLTSANWNDGTATTAYGDACPVTFNDSNGGSGNYAVTLNALVSPASVTVSNSSGNYVISGSGGIAGGAALSKSGSDTITLDTANSFTGGVTVSAGTLVAGVSGALPDGAVKITGGTLRLGTNTGNPTVSSLSISSGEMDIGNNTLFITYGSSDPISTIAGYIKTGYNSGNWNGTGIISSSARTKTNGLVYGVGWADGKDNVVSGLNSGTIELKYTLLGDANLDGTVNGSDFSILAANFGLGVTNWDQGNFLFSSSVNGSDFSALAANFGQGDSGADVGVSVADIAALDVFAEANGLALPSIGVVPEPVSAGIVILSGLGMLALRRRRGRAGRISPNQL